ncbi:MAG: hypothetical protein RR614_08315 [Eubacterium sp.]
MYKYTISTENISNFKEFTARSDKSAIHKAFSIMNSHFFTLARQFDDEHSVSFYKDGHIHCGTHRFIVRLYDPDCDRYRQFSIYAENAIEAVDYILSLHSNSEFKAVYEYYSSNYIPRSNYYDRSLLFLDYQRFPENDEMGNERFTLIKSFRGKVEQLYNCIYFLGIIHGKRLERQKKKETRKNALEYLDQYIENIIFTAENLSVCDDFEGVEIHEYIIDGFRQAWKHKEITEAEFIEAIYQHGTLVGKATKNAQKRTTPHIS